MTSHIDLHIHSNASDGTDNPSELLAKIYAAGIKTFALTDHDTIAGAIRMSKIVRSNVKFVKGIEFSCITRGENKCHILGLNYDESNTSFQEALRTGEELRHEKFYRRIEILRDKFNITFTDNEIDYLLGIPSVGKPHIANLIVNKGLAHDKNDAIARYIDKCGIGNDKINAELAISAINSSGGISVWAHPLGGEREPELSEHVFTEILCELGSYGLTGLECYYSKYELAKCDWLAEIARDNNLYISGGSDYHGANKNIPLGKLNAENLYVNENIVNIAKNF